MFELAFSRAAAQQNWFRARHESGFYRFYLNKYLLWNKKKTKTFLDLRTEFKEFQFFFLRQMIPMKLGAWQTITNKTQPNIAIVHILNINFVNLSFAWALALAYINSYDNSRAVKTVAGDKRSGFFDNTLPNPRKIMTIFNAYECNQPRTEKKPR